MMNYTNRTLYTMVYLIYRTQLEFHTGSSPAVGKNQWIPETKLGHYVCLTLVLLCTRGRRRKHEEKKAWSPGQSLKSKKNIQPSHTYTHLMRMTGSFAQFCLWVLSRHVSPWAADERAGCSSVSLPRAPENVNTLFCNTSKARHTHTRMLTHTNNGERSPATTYHKHETFS